MHHQSLLLLLAAAAASLTAASPLSVRQSPPDRFSDKVVKPLCDKAGFTDAKGCQEFHRKCIMPDPTVGDEDLERCAAELHREIKTGKKPLKMEASEECYDRDDDAFAACMEKPSADHAACMKESTVVRVICEKGKFAAGGQGIRTVANKKC